MAHNGQRRHLWQTVIFVFKLTKSVDKIDAEKTEENADQRFRRQGPDQITQGSHFECVFRPFLSDCDQVWLATKLSFQNVFGMALAPITVAAKKRAECLVTMPISLFIFEWLEKSQTFEAFFHLIGVCVRVLF